MATDLGLHKLALATNEVGLADVANMASAILQGTARGRMVVDVRR